jgi:hypothetical protein
MSSHSLPVSPGRSPLNKPTRQFVTHAARKAAKATNASMANVLKGYRQN